MADSTRARQLLAVAGNLYQLARRHRDNGSSHLPYSLYSRAAEFLSKVDRAVDGQEELANGIATEQSIVSHELRATEGDGQRPTVVASIADGWTSLGSPRYLP